jgi:hypothetical protein
MYSRHSNMTKTLLRPIVDHEKVLERQSEEKLRSAGHSLLKDSPWARRTGTPT